MISSRSNSFTWGFGTMQLGGLHPDVQSNSIINAEENDRFQERFGIPYNEIADASSEGIRGAPSQDGSSAQSECHFSLRLIHYPSSDKR